MHGYFFSALTIIFTLSALPSAHAEDFEAAKKLYVSRGCVGCHGVNGDSKIPAYPVLKAKPADFLKAQLLAFREGTRKNPIMNGMAANLADAEIEQLAAYLSAQ